MYNVHVFTEKLLSVFALFHYRRYKMKVVYSIFANTYLLCVAFINFFCDLNFTYGIKFCVFKFYKDFYLHCHYFNIHNRNSDGNSTANGVIYSINNFPNPITSKLMQPQKKHPISVAVWKTLLQSIDVLLSHLLLHCLNFVSSMPDRLSTKLYESKITLWMNASIY